MTNRDAGVDRSIARLYEAWFTKTGSENAAASLVLAQIQAHRPAPGDQSMFDLLKPQQVAQQLGVSPDTVLGWIRSGQLKAANLGANRARYVIDRQAVDEFLRKRQPEPPEKRPPKRRPSSEGFKRYRS